MKAILIVVFGGIVTWVILSASGENDLRVQQNKLDWTHATSKTDIDKAWNTNKPILFFKHSTHCGLSMMVLEDLERDWDVSSEACKLVFIDIFKYREVANYLSEKTGVRHHSPQVFLIDNGEIKYHKTHMDIKVFEIKRLILE